MKNKKAEIGTIVMMAFLVLISVVAFGSSNFLAKKQTTSTRAAGCGSGGAYDCISEEGYSPEICKTASLEFNCCVADSQQGDGSYRIRRYGCTGQYCKNTKINNALGHLVGCTGFTDASNEELYSLNPAQTAIIFTPTADNTPIPTQAPEEPGLTTIPNPTQELSQPIPGYCWTNSKCSSFCSTLENYTMSDSEKYYSYARSDSGVFSFYDDRYSCNGNKFLFAETNYQAQLIDFCGCNPKPAIINTITPSPTTIGPSITPTLTPIPTIDTSGNCVEARCDYPYESVKIRSKCSQVNSSNQCEQVGFYRYSDSGCTNSIGKNDICANPGLVPFKINAQINLNPNTIIGSGSHMIKVYRKDVWNVSINTTETTGKSFPINIPITINSQHNPGTDSFYIKFCYHNINNDLVCVDSETQKFPGGTDPVINLPITL